MPPSKNITFDELSKYFHLPINQVAKELGVCATILKKKFVERMEYQGGLIGR